jgi:ATP-dependent exoDNAse (exonuclease V) beta subunit
MQQRDHHQRADGRRRQASDHRDDLSRSILDIDLTYENALKSLRGNGKKGDSIHEALVSHRAAVALVALSRRFISFLDQEKRLLGVVDFDDLLLRTAALLEDPQIAERVRQQFDYVFVDEFQDTDRTQARIIERLASDRTGAWVDGKTLIVGDPKQSIYGFRLADPETYRRFSDQLTSSGAEHRIIRDQYRTHPDLLEELNAIFRCVSPARAPMRTSSGRRTTIFARQRNVRSRATPESRFSMRRRPKGASASSTKRKRSPNGSASAAKAICDVTRSCSAG